MAAPTAADLQEIAAANQALKDRLETMDQLFSKVQQKVQDFESAGAGFGEGGLVPAGYTPHRDNCPEKSPSPSGGAGAGAGASSAGASSSAPATATEKALLLLATNMTVMANSLTEGQKVQADLSRAKLEGDAVRRVTDEGGHAVSAFLTMSALVTQLKKGPMKCLYLADEKELHAIIRPAMQKAGPNGGSVRFVHPSRGRWALPQDRDEANRGKSVRQFFDHGDQCDAELSSAAASAVLAALNSFFDEHKDYLSVNGAAAFELIEKAAKLSEARAVMTATCGFVRDDIEKRRRALKPIAFRLVSAADLVEWYKLELIMMIHRSTTSEQRTLPVAASPLALLSAMTERVQRNFHSYMFRLVNKVTKPAMLPRFDAVDERYAFSQLDVHGLGGPAEHVVQAAAAPAATKASSRQLQELAALRKKVAESGRERGRERARGDRDDAKRKRAAGAAEQRNKPKGQPCYNCGRQGHQGRDCSAPPATCGNKDCAKKCTKHLTKHCRDANHLAAYFIKKQKQSK